MYVWANSLDSKKSVKIRHLRWWGWLLIFALATGLSAAFFWEIPAFVEAIAGPDMYPYVGVTTPHMLDAVASACNLMGMLLMVLRCWEQWLWWLALDLIQICESLSAASVGSASLFEIVPGLQLTSSLSAPDSPLRLSLSLCSHVCGRERLPHRLQRRAAVCILHRQRAVRPLVLAPQVGAAGVRVPLGAIQLLQARRRVRLLQ